MASPEKFLEYVTNQAMTLMNATNSVFGASGASHSIGLVADPGSSAGTTRFLREDATWQVPPLPASVATLTVTNLTVSTSETWSFMSPGSVAFAGASGAVSQDNNNFFWDNTNKRLGIGTASPGAGIDILNATGNQAIFRSSGANNAAITINNVAGGNQSSIFFNDAGTSKWQIGKQTDNTFFMFDSANGHNFLAVTTGGALTLGESTSVAATVQASTFEVNATLRIDQTPTACTNAGSLNSTVTISNSADSSSNMGHRISVNMNGTTYWIPCGTVAF